ncbi:hypothetical protein FOMPIDRAFT_1048737 [Fomitopsis schrenkii]|uniref:Uncharacterized protein n=1 Tax=Fomitopsis schrenkii TaxID=2126942 RepID=S8EEB8_FOMSC|nr:hypothetical protein FOMPIDRAFT_1048737 [Fomitopsis schrenkii]
MPHLPQGGSNILLSDSSLTLHEVKRSPKFTLSTSGDKATGKQPTKVPRAIPPAAPHYVALPGLSPAGNPTDQGRKANTTSGVKFEQYHMWSRKAKSLRNLKATQADALVYLSGSTNTFPRSMSSPPRKQRLLDTPTRPSISSVLLSAHTKEGTAVGDMLRIRRRSIPGDALLERPSSAESSSEGSLHLGILSARSMSTTALPELVKRQPETTSKRSPPWLARFRRRAPSAAGSTSEHWQSNA